MKKSHEIPLDTRSLRRLRARQMAEEAETLIAIRRLRTRLNELSEGALKELYRQWSQQTACANWLAYNDRRVCAFAAWALTAPCDYCVKDQVEEALFARRRVPRRVARGFKT